MKKSDLTKEQIDYIQNEWSIGEFRIFKDNIIYKKCGNKFIETNFTIQDALFDFEYNKNKEV